MEKKSMKSLFLKAQMAISDIQFITSSTPMEMIRTPLAI
jgi:hypothetical protein